MWGMWLEFPDIDLELNKTPDSLRNAGLMSSLKNFCLYSCFIGVWFFDKIQQFGISWKPSSRPFFCTCYNKQANSSTYPACSFCYRNFPKFSDRQVWANSADPDQRSSLIRVYTVCNSLCIIWMDYSKETPSCSTFRVITTNFLGVRIFRKFTVFPPCYVLKEVYWTKNKNLRVLPSIFLEDGGH